MRTRLPCGGCVEALWRAGVGLGAAGALLCAASAARAQEGSAGEPSPGESSAPEQGAEAAPGGEQRPHEPAQGSKAKSPGESGEASGEENPEGSDDAAGAPPQGGKPAGAAPVGAASSGAAQAPEGAAAQAPEGAAGQAPASAAAGRVIPAASQVEVAASVAASPPAEGSPPGVLAPIASPAAEAAVPPAAPAPAVVAPGGQRAGEAPSAAAPEVRDVGSEGSRACSAFDQLRGLCEPDGDAPPPKRWRVIARVIAARNVVVDEDPQNDTFAQWIAGGEVDLPAPLRGFYATAFVAVNQSFYPEPEESALQVADPLLAIGYRHSIGLDALGLENQSVMMVHRGGVFLPLSRTSEAQDLQAELDWITALRWAPVGGSLVGFNLRNQYRFHRYAERAGTAGGLNDRMSFLAALVGQQQLYEHSLLGQFFAQGSLGSRYTLRYPSRDEFEAETSDQAPWFQSWLWSLGAAWVPSPYASVTLSVGQDSPLLRQGVFSTAFADREELRWELTLTGTY